MRPSAMLRSLSFRIPARLLASPAITPLPVRTSFDQQLSAELNTLHTDDDDDESSLLLTLEASISTQKIALHSLSNLTNYYTRDDHSDQKAIDEYLDHDSIQMLDACNHFSEKIEIIRKYVESLRVVSHLLDDGKIDQPSAIVLARANNALQSCEEVMERSRRTRKLLSRQRQPHSAATKTSVSELGEILSGSKAVALMACRFLGHALSLKSKRCCSWPRLTQKKVKVESEKHKRSSSSMTLTELRVASRELRDEIKAGNHNYKVGVAVEKLQRSCGELEERIDGLEERVKVLYKHLIDIRMALLGILSQA